jgi:hypothetical protein
MGNQVNYTAKRTVNGGNPQKCQIRRAATDGDLPHTVFWLGQMRRWNSPKALAIGHRVDTKVPPVSTHPHPQVHSISVPFVHNRFCPGMEIEEKKYNEDSHGNAKSSE